MMKFDSDPIETFRCCSRSPWGRRASFRRRRRASRRSSRRTGGPGIRSIRCACSCAEEPRRRARDVRAPNVRSTQGQRGRARTRSSTSRFPRARRRARIRSTLRTAGGSVAAAVQRVPAPCRGGPVSGIRAARRGLPDHAGPVRQRRHRERQPGEVPRARRPIEGALLPRRRPRRRPPAPALPQVVRHHGDLAQPHLRQQRQAQREGRRTTASRSRTITATAPWTSTPSTSTSATLAEFRSSWTTRTALGSRSFSTWSPTTPARITRGSTTRRRRRGSTARPRSTSRTRGRPGRSPTRTPRRPCAKRRWTAGSSTSSPT